MRVGGHVIPRGILEVRGIPPLFSVLAICLLQIGCGEASDDGADAGNGAGGSVQTATGGSVGAGGTSSAVGGSGGTGQANACSSFAPCGGNVLGRWKIQASCSGTFASTTECEGYVTSNSTSGDALYAFAADGTATSEGSLTTSMDISVTDACAASLQQVDAAEYCKNTEEGTSGVPSTATCTASAGVCECHVITGPIQGPATPEAYQTSGTNITIGSRTQDYCVSGDTLTFGFNGYPSTVWVREITSRK